MVLDGWGIAKPGKGNCLSLANIKNFNDYMKKFPHTELRASGIDVGLPLGTMGNSEVGHLHLGAGRIVWQPLQRINNEIKSGEFFKNAELVDAMRFAKHHKSALHIMGLCSDGCTHADIKHLFALLKMAKEQGLNEVYIHFFADGRDVPEKSAAVYAGQIEKEIKKVGLGKIVSISGRYYAMDRDNAWERTIRTYEALTEGKGHIEKNIYDAIRNAYARGDRTDYYMQPALIVEEGGAPVTIKDRDSVIFFNTRTDRVRQLIKCFCLKRFKAFKRKVFPKVHFTTFVQTDKTIPGKMCRAAFRELEVRNNFSHTIEKAGIKQARIGETEKYPHITYFFNSQIEKPMKGEKRILVHSAKVPSFDMKPEMSAHGIAEKAVSEIHKGDCGFMLVNFANADIVGHSAKIPAIIKAVEFEDKCIAKVVDAATENGYTVIITSDHGNAEQKLTKDGVPIPSHSSNKVPFVLISDDKTLAKTRFRKEGGLIDVAPTMLEIIGLKKPREMTGKSLIV
jgi:2,3-bisphosphoglycerate-independent phosphoglycerate mutase